MTSSRPEQPGGSAAPTLARRVGLFLLIVYGVGDIVGSGIYGTIGVAAGAMGNAVWLAFAAAMIAALLTGCTYASISSRYPRAAGIAYVAQRAFRKPAVAYVLGLMVLASGLTSIGTASNVFAANLSPMIGGISVRWLVVGFLGGLALINFIGIRESLRVNMLCTLVEVGGLIFIVAVGARFWGSRNYLEIPASSGSALVNPSLLLTGAVLTFYSFVGFEDMINVAEEVREPEKTLPRALLAAVGIATLLYMAVSITAVSVVDYRDLARSELGAPLSQITRKAAPWLPAWVFGAITLFAVANTALLNHVMASRLMYGMARQRLLPRFLGTVHSRRRTPHTAILVLTGIALALALAGNIRSLARSTSVLLLCAFASMNLALIILKNRSREPRGRFEIPRIIPALGLGVCLLILVHAKRAELTIAGLLLAGIVVLHLLMKPRGLDEGE